MKDLVGYRFAPTGEELINHYLKSKNLGKTWLVDEAINEINICSYDPIYLPSLAKIQSDDHIWYFFSPKEYTSEKKKVTKRTTASGYWKATGVDRIIKDKRGNKGEIGVKKTLVYYEGRVPKGVRTPWVMHEYHVTCLPHHLRAYVICQVMYKGEDGDIPFVGNNQSEPSQSLVSDSRTDRAFNIGHENMQLGQEIDNGLSVDELMNPMNELEPVSLWDVLDPNLYNPSVESEAPRLAPNDDEFLGELRHVDRGQVEYLFSNEEFKSTPSIVMTENCNHYMPKKPLSGVIVNYSSDADDDDDDDGDDGDDDAESTSELSYQGTSSPGDDSIRSSNRHFLQTDGDEIISTNTKSCNDLQTYGRASISTMTKTQEVKQDTSMEKKSCMVKKEKKGWFYTEETMKRNRKNPQYIYLMNTMIGFILLLGLIGEIISVLLSVKI